MNQGTHQNQSNENAKIVKRGHDNSAVVALMELNPNTDYLKDEIGSTPFHLAVYAGDFDAVKSLVAQGIDINELDKVGFNALHYAVKRQNTQMIEFLIKKGINVNAASLRNHTTPLLLAVFKCNKDIVELLLKHGADVNIVNKNSRSPLYIACMTGNKDIVELLLKLGADVNKADCGGGTPLYVATCKGHTDCVRIMLNYNANVDLATYASNNSPILIAAAYGFSEITKLLINETDQLDKPDSEGKTPLMLSSLNGYGYITNILLNTGKLNLNAADKENYTVIYYAVQSNNSNIIELLIKNGADIRCIHTTNRTPLHWAVLNRTWKSLSTLLKYDADINAKDRNMKTPLHYAAQEGYIEGIKILVKRYESMRIDINTVEIKGRTPLHLAAMRGHLEAVKYLVKHGADPLLKDLSQKLPIQLAQQANKMDVVDFLNDALSIRYLATATASKAKSMMPINKLTMFLGDTDISGDKPGSIIKAKITKIINKRMQAVATCYDDEVTKNAFVKKLAQTLSKVNTSKPVNTGMFDQTLIENNVCIAKGQVIGLISQQGALPGSVAQKILEYLPGCYVSASKRALYTAGYHIQKKRPMPVSEDDNSRQIKRIRPGNDVS